MPPTRDSPRSEASPDRSPPIWVMPESYSLNGGKNWVLAKDVIWGHPSAQPWGQPISPSRDRVSNGENLNFHPARNNRLAPVDVSKHVAGAPTNRDHNIGASTSNVSGLHPSSISRPSRPIDPFSSPSRLSNNAPLGRDTGTAMTIRGQSSLLTGSAPDTESNSPSSSNVQSHQDLSYTASAEWGKAFQRLTLQDTKEFVPSKSQHSWGPLGLMNRQTSLAASHASTPTETNTNNSNNLYGPEVGQDSSRYGTTMFQRTRISNVEQADPIRDDFTKHDSPHPSWNSIGAVSHPSNTTHLQDGWAHSDNFHNECSQNIHRKTSTLRPEVPSYRPLPHTAPTNSNASRQKGTSYTPNITNGNSGEGSQQISLVNSNAYAFNSTVGTTFFAPHHTNRQHVASPDTINNDKKFSGRHDFGATMQPYNDRYAVSSNSRSRTASDDRQLQSYTAGMQHPYSNEHYGYTSDVTQALPYQQPYGDRAVDAFQYYPGDNYSQNTDSNVEGRSALLEEFRLYHKSRKYEIKDIYGHIVEFSGDQAGSRFIQTKLEVANGDEKSQIFVELQSDARQLMTDLFGNYVIQKMFDHGSQSQKKTLASHMQGYVLKLSMQAYGCRCVQKALEHVLTDQQVTLIRELDGHVISVVESLHGNHVIQKAIECIPGEHIQFIVDAHKNQVVRLSKNIYGCRIIQRLLEYCSPHAKQAILDELLCAIPVLINDQYGNYVVQCIMNNCSQTDRHHVVEIVRQRLLFYSMLKFASNVVENAMRFADERQRTEMIRQLTEPCPENGMQSPVLALVKDQYGNYVMQTVLKILQGPSKKALADEIHQYISYMPKTNRPKQILAMADLINTIRAGHSPSSISTGPQTPRTPSSLHSGGSMGTLTKDVDILSHGYPLREHRGMVPLKPLY